MSKVIVTGGGGFIGRAVIKKLLSNGYEVEALVRYGDAVNLPVKVHPIGLHNKDRVKKILHSDDIVIHLAWSSVPVTSAVNSKNDVISNLPHSLNLIEACVEKKVSNLLFFSSGGTVYGNPRKLPIDETHPTDPVSPYGIDKLMVEKYILMYSHRFGLPFTILRVSNAYGPRYRLNTPQGVIGHWINQLKEGGAIELVGNGDITRDFIHIEDICNATLFLLEKPTNEVYNLGSQKGVSLNQLFEILETSIRRKLKIRRLPERSFDVRSNILNIEKIRKDFGWEPVKSLEKEIEKILISEDAL